MQLEVCCKIPQTEAFYDIRCDGEILAVSVT